MSPSLDNTNHKFVHICCLKIELGRNNGIIATKCNPGECYIYRIGEYLATDFLGSLNIPFVPFLHQCSLIFCILLEILLTCDAIKSLKNGNIQYILQYDVDLHPYSRYVGLNL